ncbi:MAG: hypothetical protein Q8Q31_00600 [Nanoarchaeota archaeon]|nr:hypothetical protein [Nanoarchaeota archaeon]
MEKKITTIKLSKGTKNRLDNLKIHPRETYEEVLQRMLEILNLCIINPLRAKMQLIKIDNLRKEEIK